MKNFRGTLIALLGSLLILTSCGIGGKKESYEYLNIISVSDLHGAILKQGNSKGMATLKADIDAIENQDDVKNTIVIGNGDMFQGTPLSNLTYGKSVINMMNALNFDVIGIGNHEFDWGIDTVLDYFDGDESNGESTAKLVNSNIYKDNKLLDHSVPYSVIDLGFIKVGVVSYAPKQLKSSILTSRVEGYDFRIIETMQNVINECKEHCDVVVSNTHYGEGYFNGINFKLAQYGSDAIINGHRHMSYSGIINTDDGRKVPVVETKDQLKLDFGLIKLKLKNKQVVDCSVENVPLGSKGHKEDETIKALALEEFNVVKDVVNAPLCVAGKKIYKSTITPWAARLVQEVTDSDIGLINSHGIRNVTFDEGDTITYGNVFDLMPFDNQIYIFTLSGDDINNFYFDDAVYAYKNKNIKIGDFDPRETYTFAIVDYVAQKFPQLMDIVDRGDAIVYEKLYRDLFMDEFKAWGNSNVPVDLTGEIKTAKKID